MKMMDVLRSACDIPRYTVDLNGAPTVMHRNVDVMNFLKSIKTKTVKYYDEDEQVWKIGEVIVDETN